MTSMFALTFIGTASAAQLTSRSDTIDDSEHSITNVQHQFVFTTPSAYTHDDTNGTDDLQFRFAFPTGTIDDPYGVNNLAPGDVSVTCTSCDSIVPIVTTVVEDSAGGQVEDDRYTVTIDTDVADVDGNLPANAVWTVTLGTGATGVDNPDDNPNANDGAAACTDGAAASDADVCSITIETSEDGAFSAVDDGDVLIAHISDVTVSVTVEESLTFSINGRTEGECETTGTGPWPDHTYAASVTASAVDFGNISTFNTFHHGCQRIAVATNAVNGYVVTQETDTSLQEASGTEIDSGTCDAGTCDDITNGAWSTATNNGFAVSCDTVQDDDAGSVCGDLSGVNPWTEVTNFRRIPCVGAAADCSPDATEPLNNIMEDSGTGDDIIDVNYKISIDPTQAAAVYTTQVTYIATPTF